MDEPTSTQPEKKEEIPLPLNLYVGKATVDLLGNTFSKDYISGDPNLPEEVKQKNRKTIYILLAIFVVLFIGLIIWLNLAPQGI
jgi:hypothetical protein